jgi:RNA polymerase sigma-70 factor (ECF subfamily)
MHTGRLDQAAIERLHRQARAERWQLALAPFAEALERSAQRMFAQQSPDARRLERFLASLHLEDLALACACAEGSEAAWEHFVREFRPVLYRSADAIDPGGGARELADSLYAELFGLHERDGERRSHFHYFHGRSSLATWLRAVLAQRHVDRIRDRRRLDPLPADETPDALSSPPQPVDSKWLQYVELMRSVLAAAVAGLDPRDRLRLRCYYAQDLTLAQIGTVLAEHEATVSRNLARTRRTLRKHVERVLRDEYRMSEAEIDECFAAVVDDAGSLDIAEMLGTGPTEQAPGPRDQGPGPRDQDSGNRPQASGNRPQASGNRPQGPGSKDRAPDEPDPPETVRKEVAQDRSQ